MMLYTRTGDEGKTSVIGGRVDKDHIRVEAYGTIDELNSFVGLATTELENKLFPDIICELQNIQHELFDCGGDLATVTSQSSFKVTSDMIQFMEERIDIYIVEAPELQRFILPGGAKAAATIHICRTITRRAERLVVQLHKENEINPNVLKYLNRLSDYFFAIARVINFRSGVKDVEYKRSDIVFRGDRKGKIE
ncbi:ATP:cob(I)alamin adenosyltransferase [Anaerobacillus alkalilacustris]|uniref:Corrinoid adenosyltransferase n=1 Tax=Anaerobacillus alkalilacustris TaxID=393763 RepID=A0A1S2LRM3_9BACI|nr:cob(I)yrinic acid a,c-diamide adenosyltransferase [Anaerobacillus alkalilacustris]OIJ14860.1 ATP:cob(I)alamin adenosyltransferase [Anaerobacillus alkalilacustris]